jgi:hypothetical protein
MGAPSPAKPSWPTQYKKSPAHAGLLNILPINAKLLNPLQQFALLYDHSSVSTALRVARRQ